MAEVKLASNPIAADHDPYLWMIYWVMDEYAPSRGTHLDDRICLAVETFDGLMDILVLLPLSGILWWLGQLLTSLLLWSMGQQLDMLVYQSKYLLW